jgi:hypothetical protein
VSQPWRIFSKTSASPRRAKGVPWPDTARGSPASPHREPAERPRRHPHLVTGVFRRAGFANIAHARRYYGHDDARILALYGYT